MLVHGMDAIGSRLYALRKKFGMTQMEVAIAADISERNYADIERGTVNMRVSTLLRICEALHVTPDDILTEESGYYQNQAELMSKLDLCPPQARRTALELLAVYLSSVTQ